LRASQYKFYDGTDIRTSMKALTIINAINGLWNAVDHACKPVYGDFKVAA
jgi:hypothetical protein